MPQNFVNITRNSQQSRDEKRELMAKKILKNHGNAQFDNILRNILRQSKGNMLSAKYNDKLYLGQITY